ncbi:hypothetical protein HHI36_021980 [Cryptolaemus montrouzieri]|uniref:Uncharacterized protein n=1 Tax=Cryptolaemus montrouzieri TaxID=559131 RepID=A0ABD2MYD4_9CUCU
MRVNTGNRSFMEGDPPNSTENYTINDVMKKLFAIEGRFQKMDRQKYNDQLFVNNKLTKEINQIKCKLENEINKNAQSLLSKNIILKGITKENTEDLKKIVSTLADKLDVPLDGASIVSCYRLGKANAGQKTPIKVVLNKEEIKTKLIKSQKNKKA